MEQETGWRLAVLGMRSSDPDLERPSGGPPRPLDVPRARQGGGGGGGGARRRRACNEDYDAEAAERTVPQ